jgi:vitamin B12 transporter
VKNRLIAVVLLLAGIICGQTAEPSAEGAYPATRSDSLFQLPEIVVVAARVEQRLSEVSLRTSRITSDRFRLNATDDAARIFEDEPGLNVRSYSTQKGASTLSIWGAPGSQVLVMMDGHPLTNSFVGVTDLGLLMLNGCDAVEIARGAGSSVYGANALGGSVDFLSENPLTHPRDRMWQRIRAGVSAPSSSDLGYYAGGRTGSFGFRGGLEQNSASGIRSNDQSHCFSAIGGAGYYPLTGTTFDVSVMSVQRDIGLPGPRPDRPDTLGYGDSTASTLYDHEQDNSLSVIGNLKWMPFGNSFKIELKPDWSLTSTSFWMLPVAYPPESARAERIKRDDYGAQNIANSLTGNLAISRFGNVVAGYDIRYEDGNVVSGINDTTWNARSLNHGLWAEIMARLPGSLSANASARYDINPDFGRAVNPHVGMAWSFGEHSRLRADWGTAFRAPTFDDRYWPIYGVRDLKPERGTTVQAGADIAIPVNALPANPNISFTAFYRRTSDLITWVPDSSGFWRPTNVDSSTCSGAEVSGDIRPITDLRLRLNATVLNGTQVRKELISYFPSESLSYVRRPAAFIPALSFGGQIEYTLPAHVGLDVNARCQSARYNYYQLYNMDGTVTTETKRLAPYVVLDAGLRHTFLQHLEVSVKVSNILNTQYAEQFGNSMSDHDYPMPGRTLSFVLRYGSD